MGSQSVLDGIASGLCDSRGFEARSGAPDGLAALCALAEPRGACAPSLCLGHAWQPLEGHRTCFETPEPTRFGRLISLRKLPYVVFLKNVTNEKLPYVVFSQKEYLPKLPDSGVSTPVV